LLCFLVSFFFFTSINIFCFQHEGLTGNRPHPLESNDSGTARVFGGLRFRANLFHCQNGFCSERLLTSGRTQHGVLKHRRALENECFVGVVCFFFCPLPIGCFFSRCFFSWTGGTRRAVWLMLSPAVWLKLSPRGLAHAFAGGLAQAFAAPHASAGGLAQALAACFLSFIFRRWPQALAVVP
jgi:hypothetical protein